MVKDFLIRYNPERSLPNEVVMTILRVTVGLSLALAHGIHKLPPSPEFTGMVVGMGFPAVFAWLSALAEFMGGLFLAAGLLTRPAAGAIAINMAVAFFIAHGSQDFKAKELALLYLVTAFMFFFRGAGAWSIDRFLDRR